MQMRPTIGITCSHDDQTNRSYLPQAYAKAIEQAGGMPLLLPQAPSSSDCISQLVHLLDGILFSGGVDVDPIHFGEEPLPALGAIAPERDGFELELARQALNADLTIFAICRGIQILNIAAGGTIYQDLPSQLTKTLKHSQEAPRWYATHKAVIKSGTFLARDLQTREIRVNSFHHQAVNRLAPGFRLSATAPDGVIEGIESENHKYVVGVQWHPETMWEKDPQMLKLFKSFVQATK
jgi:putative glutamine amidotransferase